MFKNAAKNQARRTTKRSRLGRSLGKRKKKGKKSAGPAEEVAQLVEAQRRRCLVKVTVLGFNTGGLVMRFKSVRVFCPISHVGMRAMTPPGEFKGETWDVLVLSASAANVVVSRRLAEERFGSPADAAT